MKNNLFTRLKFLWNYAEIFPLKYKLKDFSNFNLYEKNIEVKNTPTNEILLPHEHIPNFLKYVKFDRLLIKILI